MNEQPWVYLRQLRKAKGLSQAELAHQIVSQSMLCHIERGRVNPSEATLARLAERLGVEANELIEYWRQFRARQMVRNDLWALSQVRDGAGMIEVLKNYSSVLTSFEFHVYLAFSYAVQGELDKAENQLYAAWFGEEQPGVVYTITHDSWTRQERTRIFMIEARVHEEICLATGRQYAAAWWSATARKRIAGV